MPFSEPAGALPRLKPLVKGALSYVVPQLRSTHGEVGLGTSDAAFCYSLFLRHVSYVVGADGRAPEVVAELGPGSSIGTGLAALLAGSRTYVALDTQSHLDRDQNLRIFERLVEMFRARLPVPRENLHATTFPPPADWGFPAGLQPDLDDARLARIEREIREGGGESIRIVAPWEGAADVAPGTIDWLWSHSCLEHVDRIGEALAAIHAWLKPGGVTTHEIDHRSHGLTAAWDGHWGVDERLWRLLRGRRPYLINRLPHAFYADRLRALGFDIELDLAYEEAPQTTPAPRFGVSQADRRVGMSFLVCRKPG